MKISGVPFLNFFLQNGIGHPPGTQWGRPLGGPGPQIENHHCRHMKGVGTRRARSHSGQTGIEQNIHPHLTCQSGLMPFQTSPSGSFRSCWRSRGQGRGGDIRQDRTGTQHQSPAVSVAPSTQRRPDVCFTSLSLSLCVLTQFLTGVMTDHSHIYTA